MKLNELTLGSKAHHELVAKARENKPTAGKLKALLKSPTCTLPDKQCGELRDALDTVNVDKVLTSKDLQDLAFAADMDVDELELMLGL